MNSSVIRFLLNPGQILSVLGLLFVFPSFAHPPEECQCEGQKKQKLQGEQISQAEAKVLLNEYQRAQKTQLKALRHRQGLEIRSVTRAQKIRLSEMKRKDAETEKEKKGGNLKEVLEERKRLQGEQVSDLSQKKIRHREEIKKIKEIQKKNLQKFQAYLSQLVRPPVELWP